MSLINKMLQDLDARGGAREDGLQQRELKAVPPPERERRPALLAAAGIGAGVVAVAAVAGWYGWRAAHAPAAQPVSVTAVATPLAPVAAAAGAGAVDGNGPAAPVQPLRDVKAEAKTNPAATAGATPVTVPPPDTAAAARLPAAASGAAAGNGQGRAAAASATPASAVERSANAATAVGNTAAPLASAPAVGNTAALLTAAPAVNNAAAPRTAAPAVNDTAAPRTAAPAVGNTAAPRTAARAAGQTGMAPAAARPLRPGSDHGDQGDAPATARTELTPKQLAENTYRRALAALQDGRVSTAMADLDRALEIDPRNDAARQTYVSLLLENRRPDDAVRQLRLALGIDPRQPGLAMILARLQLERGGPALQTLMTSLPYAGTNADYQGFLAGVLQREQRHAEAVQYYQAALKLSPLNGVWWMGLGISLQAAQRPAEAREAFTRARTGNGITPELLAFIDRRLDQLSRSAPQ